MNKEQAMSCAAKCMSSFNKYATKWNIPSHLTIEMWNIIKEVYDRMDSPITTCNIDRNGGVELEYREAFSNVFYNVYVCSCKNARYNTSASFSKHVKLQKDKIRVIDRGRIVFDKTYIPISDSYKQVFQTFLDERS